MLKAALKAKLKILKKRLKNEASTFMKITPKVTYKISPKDPDGRPKRRAVDEFGRPHGGMMAPWAAQDAQMTP